MDDVIYYSSNNDVILFLFLFSLSPQMVIYLMNFQRQDLSNDLTPI